MRFRHVLTLALLVLVAAVAAGCGDDNDTAASENAAATGSTGDAMKKEGDAMKKEGDAMKKEGAAMKEGDAMKKEDDAMMSSSGATVKVGKTSYGKILQDKRGRTLYLFTKEKSSKSECYGDCARAWPPLITKGKPKAGSGAIASKLGTTKRRGGKQQVTYNGHPLYYYVDEDEPNEVLCQAVEEFGGIWYVVDRKGNAVTSK
jgi:predicted lipoprotein with Yx(FWY)xxD motif